MLEKHINTVKARPAGLPDFAEPPLNEVVLGVQFATPSGYQQIHAGRVWDLFQAEYSVVQEYPPLVPNFETFGLPHQHFAVPPISFNHGTSHSRYWFLRPEGDELIQFQADKFLHNWRKNPIGDTEYPRYEAIISKFQAGLSRVEDYMVGLSGSPLAINQCEITYINRIATGVGDEQKSLANWFGFINPADFNPEDVSISLREILKTSEGKPFARIYVEISTAYFPTGEKFYAMNINVRGAPKTNSIASAIEFLDIGRVAIVNKFAQITTPQAHAFWKRES